MQIVRKAKSLSGVALCTLAVAVLSSSTPVHAASLTLFPNMYSGFTQQPFGTAAAPVIVQLVNPASVTPHFDYMQVQDTSGTGPINYTLNYNGNPAIQLRTLISNQVTPSLNGTISSGADFQNISWNENAVGTFTGTFSLLDTTHAQMQSIPFTVKIVDAPNVVANNSVPLDATNGATISLDDPLGTSIQRADLKVTSVPSTTITGPFSDNGTFFAGKVIPVDTTGTGAVTDGVSFNSSGLLNGTYFGTISIPLTSNTSPSGLILFSQTATWNLTGKVTGQTGGGSAPLQPGQSYGTVAATNNSGHQTTAKLLGGQADPTNGTTVNITFNAGQPTSGFKALGDELTLSGTAGTEFVLAMDVSSADLQAAFGLVPAAGSNSPALSIQWYSTANSTWKDSVLGNSTGHNTPVIFANESYAQFLAANGGTLVPSMLGSEGFTYTGSGAEVWAILDHNSDFNVGAAPVPEPASLSLIGVAAVAILRRPRVRRQRHLR